MTTIALAIAIAIATEQIATAQVQQIATTQVKRIKRIKTKRIKKRSQEETDDMNNEAKKERNKENGIQSESVATAPVKICTISVTWGYRRHKNKKEEPNKEQSIFA